MRKTEEPGEQVVCCEIVSSRNVIDYAHEVSLAWQLKQNLKVTWMDTLTKKVKSQGTSALDGELPAKGMLRAGETVFPGEEFSYWLSNNKRTILRPHTYR